MLSLTHKFLFIHIPKTGGNSIQNILSQYSDDRIVCIAPHQDGKERFEVRSIKYNTTKHSTLADYRCEYGDELFRNLLKFCCVRNPWDRCISHFFSPHRGPIEWNREDFIDFTNKIVKPLKHYICVDCQKETFLKDSINNIDFVLKYESLQDDFNMVCRLLNIPTKILPHRNASGKDNYKKYYDTQTATYVSEKFHEEISYFGYSL